MAAAMSPEYVNQNKGPKILAVFWSLTSLTMLVVLARLFIRMRVLRSTGADDLLIAVSMIVSLSYTILTTVNVVLGYGRHTAVITDQISLVLLLNNIDFLLGIMSFSLPKLAIVALLNRLFNPVLSHRIALWGLTGLVGLVSCICVVVIFTICDPPQAQWDTSLLEKGATCRDRWSLVYYAIFNGALSAFSDLALAAYPVVHLLKLKMSFQKRLALCAALGMGAISAAMAIVKCFQLPGLADGEDPTYGTSDLVIWTSVEANVIILASCIPTLQPLFEIILGKRGLRSTTGNSYSNYKDSSQMRSGKGRPAKDDLGFTVVGSQENILQPGDGEGDNGQIHRTDDITVQYEMPSLENGSRNHHREGGW